MNVSVANQYILTGKVSNPIYFYWGKRFISLVLSLIALPVAAIPIAVFGVLIKCTDGGSVFYVSERLGMNGRVFNMYKLRSMHMNSKLIRSVDGLTAYKEADDTRVTKIGRFIRKFGIDELPQILNVLLGDMSFIGPRPDLTDTIDRLTGIIPNPIEDATPDNFFEDYYKVRMSVRPGITGYGPIFVPRGLDRVQKDMADAWYAENMSFILDVKVFIGTIAHILTGKHR